MRLFKGVLNRIFVICLALTVLALLLCTVTSAKTVTKTIEGITFSISDSYKIFTADKLESPNDVEGFKFAAISNDGKNQIQCRSTETDFSKDMGSFKGLNGEDLKPVGEKLFPNGFETTEMGHDVYLKSTSVNGNEFNIVYVTVSDKKLFTFSYFGSDPTVIGEFVGNVNLPDNTTKNNPNVIMIVVLSVAVLGFAVFLGVLIMSLIKDYRHRKMEQSENIVSNYIKIKRRKY
ncbi:MAG: hypothetical protein J6S13_00205 [Clostridia bacterium]|nr:hypothetical protein [Clostridia bacterium]